MIWLHNYFDFNQLIEVFSSKSDEPILQVENDLNLLRFFPELRTFSLLVSDFCWNSVSSDSRPIFAQNYFDRQVDMFLRWTDFVPPWKMIEDFCHNWIKVICVWHHYFLIILSAWLILSVFFHTTSVSLNFRIFSSPPNYSQDNNKVSRLFASALILRTFTVQKATFWQLKWISFTLWCVRKTT